MTTGIKVKDAMVARVVTASPAQTVLEASRIMFKEDVGSLIVLEDDRAIGIVTREDIINKAISQGVQPASITISDIMSKTLTTCTPEDDISQAARLMSKNRYERIPVVSMGRLVGIISAREIAKVAPAALEVMTEHLRIEAPGSFKEDVNEGGDCEKCGNYSDELFNVNDSWICDSCKEEAEV
jgi:CBS domain-containing protein